MDLPFMKIARTNKGSRNVLFKLSALLMASSFQCFPGPTAWALNDQPILLAADENSVGSPSSDAIKPAATTTSSASTGSNASTATSRTTVTTAAPQKPVARDHAGATIINDDSAATDDSDQAAVGKDGSKPAPVVEYKENAQTIALCKQAATYSNQKQYGQAISILTAAITRDPRTMQARRLYAETTILNNEPDRAISVLLAIAKYTKPTVYDKCMLASAYYAKRNAAQAVSNFKDATQLAPENFYAEEGLLRSLLLARDFKNALSECTSALERFQNPTAQVALKKFYVQIQTEAQADRANGLQPGDTHLTPPIPLQELTPYLINNLYGG